MPLLWISLAFIAGLVLGAYLPWPAAGWLTSASAALLACLTLRKLPERAGILAWLSWLAQREPHLFTAPLVLIMALALGGARMAVNGPDISRGHVAGCNDQGTFRMVGVLEAPADRRDRTTQLKLRIEQFTPADEGGRITGQPQPAHGLALALIQGRADWQYGDRLEITGKPVTPPEDEGFSYRDYLARQGVYTYLTYPQVRLVEHGTGSPLLAAIYRLRDWAYAEVFHLFPAPEAPLLAGILLGIDTDLPDNLARAFQDTGTAHVIAISGFNIAILAELFSKLFGKVFSRWWAAGLAVFAIGGYTLLVGATPSVVRAAVMGSLGLAAHQIGRRSTGANSLALTAALMCLPNPQLPWDASFQLSFGATLGLILYSERLQTWFTQLLERRWAAETARKIAGPVGEYVLMTLAAQLLTLPIILYHFQRLSVSSLLANPLILPPQPLVMVLSGVAVLAGLVSDPLAHLLAWLAWPLSAYTIRLVELLADLPGGVLVLGELNLWTVGLLYGVVLAPAFSKRFPALLKNLVTPAILLCIFGLAASVLWRGVAAAPDGRLRLVIFDLEGSQAILVRGPGGETVLVNGSPSARLLNDALDRWLSPFDRELDGLLINTTQASELGGLTGSLDSHTVQRAWWGIEPPDNRTGDRLVEALQDQHTESHLLKAGEALSLGGEARLEARTVTAEGSALLLTWQNFRALIPGGVTPDRLVRDDLAGLSLIILEAKDLEKTKPEVWLGLAPQAIIYTPGDAVELPEGLNWLNTRPGGWYAITTDGRQMRAEKKE